MANVLVDFFRQNSWANMKMLAYCSRLDDGQLDASVEGTYGSIRDTLVHMVAAQGRYVDRILGAPPAAAVAEQDGWPGFERLQTSVRETNATLEEIAGRADSIGMIRTVFRGESFELPVSLLLTQAINHTTDHRSQINTILTQIGVEPLNVDGWSWMVDGYA